jgi:hypothetical protein
VNPGNSFSTSTTLTLPDGPQTVLVRAVTKEGFVGVATRDIDVEAQPPGITILEPADNAVLSEEWVRVVARVDALTDTVTVDGVATSVDGYLRYAWVHLADGSNTLIATVTRGTRTNTDSVLISFQAPPGYDPNADDDGDGVPNGSDLFPHDPGNSGDGDQDGVGDGSDPDPGDPSVSSVLIITQPTPGLVIHAQ